MEADSMSEEWNWKNFARSAALTAATGAGAVMGGHYLTKEPPKMPSQTVLTRPDEQKPEVAQQPKFIAKPELKSPESIFEKSKKTPEKVTPNFNWGEFMSKDGSPIPDKYKSNILELAKNLEVLRNAANDAPISLTSGYRSPEHNANVGGENNSQHLLGKAADIRIKGMSPVQVYALIEKLIAEGKMAQGGLGLYVKQGFVHYDIRGKEVRW